MHLVRKGSVMIQLDNKQNCCGCYACENVCPKSCIKMELDQEGFRYPVVNPDLCISCGLCEQVCPIANRKEKKIEEGYPIAVACKNIDENTRKRSSSGGIFPLLAERVLQKGGSVFGAVYDSNFTVLHTMINEESQIAAMQGSKYVQSRIEHSYREAKKLLDRDKPVLFSGTPCQINGLYCFLGRDYEKLYTVDIVCHGVPSEKVWKNYLAFLEKKYKSRILHVNFRNKEYGWKNYFLHIDFENGRTYKQVYYYDAYMRGYLKNIFLRPSCHVCRYKGFSYKSNLTLADYWGVWKECPEMYDDKGTSLVIVKNEKGRKLLDLAIDVVQEKQVSLEGAIAHNPSIIRATEQSEKREQFFSDIERKNIQRCLMSASEISEIQLCKAKIKQLLKKRMG